MTETEIGGGELADFRTPIADPLGHEWHWQDGKWVARIGSEVVWVAASDRNLKAMQSGEMARLFLDTQTWKAERDG